MLLGDEERRLGLPLRSMHKTTAGHYGKKSNMPIFLKKYFSIDSDNIVGMTIRALTKYKHNDIFDNHL